MVAAASLASGAVVPAQSIDNLGHRVTGVALVNPVTLCDQGTGGRLYRMCSQRSLDTVVDDRLGERQRASRAGRSSQRSPLGTA